MIKLELREQVLQRDKRTCQNCGKTKGRLELHHIIPRRRKGIETENNLITLCVKCHRRIEPRGYVSLVHTVINHISISFDKESVTKLEVVSKEMDRTRSDTMRQLIKSKYAQIIKIEGKQS